MPNNNYKKVYNITKSIDKMFLQDRFNEVDAIIESIVIPETSTDELVAYATATSPAKDKLKKREKFFKDTETELKSRKDWDPTHLSGLE